MKNNERQFYIYECEVSCRKNGAPAPEMSTLCDIWKDWADRDEAISSIRNDSGSLLIGDVVIDPAQSMTAILVRLSDQMLPNSVYSDPNNAVFVEHTKVDSEGGERGAHIFISTEIEQGKPNIYCCAVERVPGLRFDLMGRILNKVLRYQFQKDATIFQYPHPAGGQHRDGTPRMESALPHIELRGRPSQSFIDDINNGRLTGISLLKQELRTPIGGRAYLYPTASELSVGIDHGNLPANLWANLKAAVKSKAQDFPTAKIQYTLPGDSRTVTVVIDAATGAPLEELYVKSERVTNLVPFLADSSETVVAHLSDRVKAILDNERNI